MMNEENDLWCHYSDMPSPLAYIQEEKNMTQEELENFPQMISAKIAAQQELINLLYSQVMDLSMMSKIELGDDVIAEIKRLNKIINE
jgi:hypothetical protein